MGCAVEVHATQRDRAGMWKTMRRRLLRVVRMTEKSGGLEIYENTNDSYAQAQKGDMEKEEAKRIMMINLIAHRIEKNKITKRVQGERISNDSLLKESKGLAG